DNSGNLIKQIIVVIVVVVVTYFTAGAASGWAASLASSWGGSAAATVAANVVAYGAAAGIVNTAAQLTSMAVGLQDSFNWTQLAQSAVVGGLTFGLSEGGFYQVSDNVVLNAAVEAVSNNVIAQSVNMALGQQDTFSWRSVASSAISGAIT